MGGLHVFVAQLLKPINGISAWQYCAQMLRFVPYPICFVVVFRSPAWKARYKQNVTLVRWKNFGSRKRGTQSTPFTHSNMLTRFFNTAIVAKSRVWSRSLTNSQLACFVEFLLRSPFKGLDISEMRHLVEESSDRSQNWGDHRRHAHR